MSHGTQELKVLRRQLDGSVDEASSAFLLARGQKDAAASATRKGRGNALLFAGQDILSAA